MHHSDLHVSPHRVIGFKVNIQPLTAPNSNAQQQTKGQVNCKPGKESDG